MNLTIKEIETKLEAGLLNRIVRFTPIGKEPIVAKIQRLSAEYTNGEVLITFMVGTKTKLTRYEWDLKYFNENLDILYGSTYTGDKRSVRRILEED